MACDLDDSVKNRERIGQQTGTSLISRALVQRLTLTSPVMCASQHKLKINYCL